jgi:hypothetical protein
MNDNSSLSEVSTMFVYLLLLAWNEKYITWYIYVYVKIVYSDPLDPQKSGRCWQVVVVRSSCKYWMFKMGLENGGQLTGGR